MNLLQEIEIIRFDRIEIELQKFILFAVAVAGKKASIIAEKMQHFFDLLEFYEIHRQKYNITPFESIKTQPFESYLRICKLGKYKLLEKSYKQLANSNINLKTCTIEELEVIHGISRKTSRFFLCFNRNVNYAILDTHILRYLREELKLDAPKSTPSSKKEYEKLEQIFLNHAKELGKNSSELDLEIWKKYSKNG